MPAGRGLPSWLAITDGVAGFVAGVLLLALCGPWATAPGWLWGIVVGVGLAAGVIASRRAISAATT